MDNFETFTTVDKAKRDELFDELRKRGLPNEQQAVKYSGVQPVLGEDGKQVVTVYSNSRSKAKAKRFQVRPQWQSNYSVAYPRELPKN